MRINFLVFLLLFSIQISRIKAQNICGNQSSTFRIEAFNDSPADFCPSNYYAVLSSSSAGSISSSRNYDPESGIYVVNYTITWNSGWWGSVDILFYEQARERSCFVCTSCEDNGSPQLRRTITLYKEPASQTNVLGLGNILMNGLNVPGISVTKGNSVSLSWNADGLPVGINRWVVNQTGGGTLFNGSIGSTVSVPTSQEGTIELSITLYNDACNAQYPQATRTITVLPSCTNDNPTISVSPIGNREFEVIDGGYPGNPGYQPGGGFRIAQSQSMNYRMNILGSTEFTNHYTITHNGGSDISYAQNGTMIDFSVNQPIGWYEFTILPKNQLVDDNCADFYPVNIFVGGQNNIFEEPCTIYLPQYLIDKGVVGVDKVMKHFMFMVKSQRGVIVQPGMVLKAGAILKVDYVGPDLESEPDKNLNWTESITYNEQGYPVSNGRSYFDSRGKAIQSQVKNYSSEVVLAAENLYDKYGRNVGTTLSAPVDYSRIIVDNGCPTEPIQFSQSMKFGFKDNFMEKTVGVEYDYTAFDSDVNGTGKEIAPDPISNVTEGTLGWYYGGQPNPSVNSKIMEPFVATTSYPYSRTVFYDDGSGEVKHQAGVGDFQRMGTHVSESRVVAIDNTDEQLLNNYLKIRNDEVFPNDANKPLNYSALAGSIYKAYAKDVHGKEQYTYADKSGKTIIVKLVADNSLSYSYYDDAGRLKCSVTPNGVMQYETLQVPFAQIDKTTYKYNHRGWLIQSEEPDGGITKLMYRKDGMVRFSQDAQQRLESKFSYVNYDRSGRTVETGELTLKPEVTLTFGTDLNYLLENPASNDGLASIGVKSDIIITHFDEADPTSPIEQHFVMGKVAYTEKQGETKTWYSYDEQGRVTEFAQSIPVIGTKVIDYKYGPDGNIIEAAYQRGTTDAFYHVYEYDLDARLKKVYTSQIAPVYAADGTIANANVLKEQAEYKYYLHGPLKRVELAGTLQGIDYVYTIEGWLKSINHYDKTKDPGNDGDDIFGMTLEYYTGDYTRAGSKITSLANAGATEYYNGNIKAMAWFTQKPAISSYSDNPTAYVYSYNNKYQLTGASWGDVNVQSGTYQSAGNLYKEDNISYDLNGNIQSMRRYKENTTTPLHDFTQYHYYQPGNGASVFTNQLKSIDGYNSSYTYNAIGQIKSMTQNNKATYAKFNAYKKTKWFAEDEAGTQLLVKYFYDDNGLRYKKESYRYDNNLLYYTTYYVHDPNGNIVGIYDNRSDIGNNNDPSDDLVIKETPIYGASRVGIYFNHNEATQYELSDHLGNVRASLRTYQNVAVVEAFSDYYPFGMVSRRTKSTENYRFGYQGPYAEHDEEETDFDGDGQGLNSFELRMYDPVIGRWLSCDPADQFPSSYVGMGNDPVRNKDEDGGNANPIHDIYTGKLLGYDSEGKEGMPYFTTPEKYNMYTLGGKFRLNHDFVKANLTSIYLVSDFVAQMAITYNSSSSYEPLPGQSPIGPDGLFYLGAGIGTGQELLYSKYFGTWMGKDFKLRSMSFNGNQYTGGKLKFGKTWATRLQYGGYVLSAWNALNIWDQYNSGEINGLQFLLEEGMNGYGTFGGIPGAAAGIGWEIGRTITKIPAYQQWKYSTWYPYRYKAFGY